MGDQFPPQQMQGTKSITYDNCGRRYKLHHWKGDDYINTVSGRTQNWLDVDGTASGLNEPTIIGSGLDEAGLWWTVDSNVIHDPHGPLKFIKKNDGPERGIGFIYMTWDNSQHNKVGSSVCGNGNSIPCPALGYMKHLGPMFHSDKGLPITANPYVAGPTWGFGWLLELNDGAPHSLKLELVEVLPDSPLMLSIAYPSGTNFEITYNAAWCSPSSSYSCKETVQSVNSVNDVRNSMGNTYHVDSNGLLTMRIIQTAQSFTGNPDWIPPNYDTPGKWNSWYALDRFSRGGVYLPKLSWGPWLDIKADCSRSGAYCSQMPTRTLVEVCPQGYTQTAYDTCCNDSECIHANDETSPITSPTPSPIQSNNPTTNSPREPTDSPNTPNPTIAPTPNPTTRTTPSPNSNAPTPVPGSCGCGPADGENQPECIGNTEQRCKQIINNEGKCKWTECNQPTAAPVNPPTPSPIISSPTPSPIQSNNPTTNSPTAAPVNPPTPSPILSSPTPSPIQSNNPTTKSPTSSEGCYSNDYKHCIPNGYNRTSCNTIWLPNGSQGNCVALWGDCTSDTTSCCGPAECSGSITKSCVPPFTETSIPTTSPTIFQMTSPPSESCSAKGEPCEINADCCKKKCKKKTKVCRK